MGAELLEAAHGPDLKSETSARPMLRMAEMSIEGMTCAACSGTVERHLRGLKGVQSVEVSLLRHRAEVVFSPKEISAQQLASEVEDLGFDSKLLGEMDLEPAIPETSARPSLRKAEMSVEGMTCAACSGTVERHLRGLKGVQSVEVSLLRHRAEVVFSPEEISAKQLASEVEDLGFDSKVLGEMDLELETSARPSLRKAEMSVEGMTCAACSGTVERHLRGLQGVQSVEVSLLRHRAEVIFSPEEISAQQLASEVEDLGFDAKVLGETDVAPVLQGVGSPVSSSAPGRPKAQPERAKLHLLVEEESQVEEVRSFLTQLPSKPDVHCTGLLLRITYRPDQIRARELLKVLDAQDFQVKHAGAAALASAPRGDVALRRDLCWAFPPTLLILTLVMILPTLGFPNLLKGSTGVPGVHAETLVLFFLATPVQCWIGCRFHLAAMRALKRRSPNMDVLISIATTLAYSYSLFMMLFSVYLALIGENIEEPPPHFFETPCTLITVVLIGRLLEDRAKQRTAAALDELVRTTPTTARLVQPGEEPETIPTELLQLGDEIEVRTGEVVPVDGPLCGAVGEDDGEVQAAFNESLLTGESRPVPKGPGDLLIGGSHLVTRRACRMRAERIGSGTALSQIVSLVERAAASAGSAPAQQTADAVARIFVPSVVLLAAITSLVWLCIARAGVAGPEHQHHHGFAFNTCEQVMFALKFGLAVLLVACPCALGLATPTAVMVSTGVAARRGILVKSARPLELFARPGVVVLDKTGTLTAGQPTVSAMAVSCLSSRNVDGQLARFAAMAPLLESSAADAAHSAGVELAFLDRIDAHANADAVPKGPQGSPRAPVPPVELLRGISVLIAASASRSEHPLSRGLEEGAARLLDCPDRKEDVLSRAPAVEDFQNVGGRGVRFSLGGIRVHVGAPSWDGSAVPSAESPKGTLGRAAEEWAQAQRQQAGTVVAVSVEQQLVALVALRDRLQPSAKLVVNALQRSGEEVWICTGDHKGTAMAVARELDLPEERVAAEALPAHKAGLVAELGSKGRRVLFVGDGLNDAPALTASDIGVAIGAGARVTVEAADVVLVKSDLIDLLTFRQLAEATVWTIKRNFAWAFVFNSLMIPLAAGVFWHKGIALHPAAAGGAMAASSIMVVTSSLMLRRFTPKAVEGLQSKLAPEAETIGTTARRLAVKTALFPSESGEEVPLTQFQDP